MRIDAHQHYWNLSRNDYGWLTPDMPILYRDYFPKDLHGILKKNWIDKTILVQAEPTLEETAYLLELADADDSIAGVVGWLDLDDELYQEHFHCFKKNKKFVGFRVMIQDMDDPNLILSNNYLNALTYFADQDVPVDLLVVCDQLPSVIKLLEKVPHLRGVIDHIAKPNIAAGELEPWKTQITQVANYKNIYCKLSGMVTEADHSKWKKEDFVPYIHHVFEVFGVDRIMYGSDWPVCLLAASYDEVMEVVDDGLPKGLTKSDIDKIYGLNARKFYKLP